MELKITIDATSFADFLKKSPKEFERAVQNAIYKGALLIERFSKINAPVDTGRLRSSISTDLRPLEATIGPHVNYAIFVHEGTRFITGRPFMKNAAEQADKQIAGIFNEEVEKVLS